jgi:hypothetical protein
MPPLLGVVDGIADEVAQDQLQQAGVGVHLHRTFPYPEHQVLAIGQRGEFAFQLVQNALQGTWRGLASMTPASSLEKSSRVSSISQAAEADASICSSSVSWRDPASWFSVWPETGPAHAWAGAGRDWPMPETPAWRDWLLPPRAGLCSAAGLLAQLVYQLAVFKAQLDGAAATRA